MQQILLHSAAMSIPYGSWSSPVTARLITTSTVRLGGCAVDGAGKLHWLEGRPQEKGRQAVVKYAPGAPGASTRGAIDVSPGDVNVRTRVHEYGGKSFVLEPDGSLIYSSFTTQRLYRLPAAGGEPMCLTPGEWKDGTYRFADGVLEPSGARLICVREDHTEPEPSKVVNEVVAVSLDGSGAVSVLARGRDFYAHPRLSEDGAALAYVCWDHPNMPWDATELRTRPLADAAAAAPETTTHTLVAGGDGDTSVLQPCWHPTSGALWFVSDASGWYNLYRLGSRGSKPEAVLPREAEFGGASPGWALGQQGYVFLSDGKVAAYWVERATGETKLTVLDDAPAPTPVEYGVTDGLPHTFGGLCAAPDGTLYMTGGSPSTTGGVYAWRGLVAGVGASAPAELLSAASSVAVPEGVISTPKCIEFPTTLGTAFGYYYPPRNEDFASDEAAPPLLVKAHGGPTGAASTSFNANIQFFTSRGFAVLDVDYGGSTGYGRDYRRRLRGAWGVVDLDDVCAGAQYLVSEGLADPKRLCIDGGSAGGYTTLSALAFRDVFTAGTSLYGVADLGTLAADTHKFESRYLDGLVGRYPEDKALYDARAPINAVDQLSCPILLLQGTEDKIVPPNQAELMHAALLSKGLPCALKMYEGEQHGFRQAPNIEDALNSELYFYSRVFGFALSDVDRETIVPFPIDNLDD